MKHLHRYNESIDELQQWINAVMENCRDIMLDMQDLGFRIDVRRSLYMQERDSVIVECRMGSNRISGVIYERGWCKELNETYERLNSYMITEGFEELERLTNLKEFPYSDGAYWAEIS